jgi:hypothetical protein
VRELIPFLDGGVLQRRAVVIRPGEVYQATSGAAARHPTVCPEGYSGPDSSTCRSYLTSTTDYDALLRDEPLVVEVRAHVEPLFFKFIGGQEMRARAVGYREQIPKGAYPRKPGSRPGEEEGTTTTMSTTSTTDPGNWTCVSVKLF